jgi:hypothetical protein
MASLFTRSPRYDPKFDGVSQYLYSNISYDIYPVPTLLRGQVQRFEFTLDDVFTNTLLPEQVPTTIVYFDVEHLREEAESVFKELKHKTA